MTESIKPITWVREIDAGTDNACWVICAMDDPGAVSVVRVEDIPSAPEMTETYQLLTRLNGAADVMEEDGWKATATAQRYDNEIVRELIEALEFYARHEHWMALSETDVDRVVLVAIGPSGGGDGWDVAEDVLVKAKGES